MKKINLLPKPEQQELKLQLFSQQLLKFWILIAASLVVFFLLTKATQIYLNRTVSDTQNKISQNKALLNSSDYRDLQRQILAINSNIKEIENLEDHHYYWSNALIELARLIPPNMQLNNIDFDSITGKIQINGQAQNRDAVIGLWSNIIKSEYFKNINFPLANLEKAKLPDFTYTFFINKDKFKSQ